MRPLRIRDRHLQGPTSLHDQHGLADRPDRGRRIETTRATSMKDRFDRDEEGSELRRHVLRLLAAEILRHGPRSDQRALVELRESAHGSRRPKRTAHPEYAASPR